MKTFGIILICFTFCVGLTVLGCSFEMSPTSSQQQAGRDLSAPDDDAHKDIGANESCGTASERSGCHSTTITIN
jgi:hypothetical protein